MSTHEFDLCVVGAGSAGFAGATTARRLGKRVAFAEGDAQLGGLCILRGCMPSKTELRSAEVAHLARTAGEVGIHVADVTPDVPAVVARKRRIIEGFADYRVEQIKQFPLFRGQPRFTGPRELQIGADTLRAAKFLLAMGSLINVPDIPGLREAGYLTSDDVLELEHPPASFITLGGGPTGCELAQYLRRMGCTVTMLQRSRTVLSQEDEDVGAALGAALEEDGIELRTELAIKRVERTGQRRRVVAQRGREELVFEADEIFMALGRRPNVDGFGLESAGVEFDRRGVKIDEYMRTSNPDIFAAGDITGNNELVHVAVYEGQLAVRNAFGDGMSKANLDLQRARAVFTDPQVAIAGRTERECKARGIEYVASSFPFNDLGKAISANVTAGFAKILAAPDGTMLGVAIVGAEAADLIHEAIALLYFHANVRDVIEMPHLHPTLSEILTYPAEELCERLEGQTHVLVCP
ncbi:MAG: FAD-dependent oxidoreductase [Candidatus Eremiobacteraeota bacterium]|nr:FAD-dependent oxidoreductase [Candidatus Eremiobacteraeota bacterium]MBV8366621.1 FAD-dependent oxidoreductase [Candidatus Eremiobacteraeota bacterium]